jgi:hypothetical protein
MKKTMTLKLLFLVLTFHCGTVLAGTPAIAPDVPERAARLVVKDMSQSPLKAGLKNWEKAVLEKLEQAACYMDAAFWQQVDPDGEKLFQELSKKDGHIEKAAALMMDANYGRWDRFQDFAPFIGTKSRPAGGYVFPPDLTREEFESYLAAHPEQKAALLSPYTVVQRDRKKLKAIPYHVAYAEYVFPAAKLLDEAAALSQNQSLTKFLKLQAEALRTDDYFEADMAWLDLDAALDLSLGPYETYDDQLAGVKTFYKANVQLVDRDKVKALAKYKSTAPDLQDQLPVPPEFRPSQTGTMMPLILVDDVCRSGQVRSIMEAVAYSLPNDPRVWKAKGAKKVMMGNYLDTRRKTVLEPLAQAILETSAARKMNSEAYFTWVLMHEITHTLGPRHSVVNGREKSIREALGQYYSPIEEGKADIGGLYNLSYLMKQGVVTGSLESHYVGYLAEALRSIRFGLGSAYGVIRLSCWNILEDKGALHYNSATERFELNVEAMTAAVKDIVNTLITFEGQGDAEGAAKFIDKYAKIRPNLANLLKRADGKVAVEFIPVYKKQPKR